MNWQGLLNWFVANTGNIVAAVMVIVKLVQAAIDAGRTKTSVTKNFFSIRRPD
jgi:hypothetical protein